MTAGLSAGTGAPQEPVPTNLVWHYTDGGGLLSILANHILWATSSAFLNDAQEVALGVGRIADRLRELALDDDTYRLITEGLDPFRSSSTVASRCYILSASETWDSLAMWRLYGGARESYAIGLDPEVPLSVLSNGGTFDDTELVGARVYLKRMRWEPVRYRADEQAALIEAVVDDLPAQLVQLRSALTALGDERATILPESTWSLVRSVLDDLEQALVLIKHEGFSEEREVRQAIVMHSDEQQPEAADLEAQLLSYRPTGYGIAPYLRLTGGTDERSVTDVPALLPIRAVAISPSPNGVAAEQSVRRLLESHGYRDVSVIRSAIPYRS